MAGNNSQPFVWSEEMQDMDNNGDVDVTHTGTSPVTKKQRTTNGTVVTIPTSNVYTPLSKIADVVNIVKDAPIRPGKQSNTSTSTNASKSNKNTPAKIRTPPITVVGKKREEIIQLCCEAGVEEKLFTLKMTSIGVNILTTNPETFTKLRELFKTKGQCFTHDMSSEKWQKVVLKGLFKMDIAELKKELEANDIKPEEIKMISPKKTKFDDQAHYLLFFKKGSTTINDLRKCRSLCYLKVEWEYYTPKKFGPTQCHNCQMFAHGSRHCTLPPKCLYCAGGHETRSCLCMVNGAPIEGFEFKCANCEGKHKANDESCPKLRKFLEIQESFNKKNGKNNKNRINPIFNSPVQFPPLPVSQPRQPQTHTPTYSQPLPPRSPTGGLGQARSQMRSNQSNRRTQLFSGPELITIAQEVISALGSCETAEDQYMTIVNLAVKFIYNGP